MAFCLLLILGCRKNELLKASGAEFDLCKKTWQVPEIRIKKGKRGGYKVPIVPLVEEILTELKVRSSGSEFVFPARRGEANRPICDNTLNAALQKLFGKGKSNGKKPYVNVFEKYNIKHFTVHDLRRTSRSLMRSKKFMGNERASFEAAERHLNHKLPAIVETYDPDDYIDEKRDAMCVLSEKIRPLIKL